MRREVKNILLVLFTASLVFDAWWIASRMQQHQFVPAAVSAVLTAAALIFSVFLSKKKK